MIQNIDLNGASVTAELHGYMYASLYGYNGVLNIGNKLAHTIVTNSEIKLSDGLVINQGRFMRIVGSESVAIENGTSGVNRTDLIVAHFETDGITETHSIKVIKGSAGGAVPTHQTSDIYNGGEVNDLVLYKVSLEGLNVASVEQMFEVIESFDKSQEKISNIEKNIKTPATVVSDLNEARTTGLFIFGKGATNAPYSDFGGTLLCINYSTTSCTQMVFPVGNHPVKYRKYLSGTWHEWENVDSMVNKLVRGDETKDTYIHFARLVIQSSYLDDPFSITLSQRNCSAGELAFAFQNVDNTDPDMRVISIRALTGCNAPRVYAYKSATSTWDFYVKKQFAYDYTTIHKLITSPRIKNSYSITWLDEEIETLPSGCKSATIEPAIKVLTQAEYDALSAKNANVLYFITE